MNLYFLDAGGAGLFAVFIGLGIFFIALAILIEALVMMLLKYNPFRKAILHSAVANLVSVIAGVVLINSSGNTFNIDSIGGLAGMFAITLIIESLILYLFNKNQPVWRTVSVCLAMNVITYAVLYLFTLLGN